VNPLLKVDLEVDATDTNTKAEGTRSVKRGETLKMVHGKQAGETRTADVQLSIDSPVNIPLPTDFPQWKGPGKVEESNGQLTAQYNGNQSGNITVNPFSANAAMQAVNVVLVPENEVKPEWKFDSEQFKGLQNTIKSGLKKITKKDVNLTLTGEIRTEFRLVDKANDGANIGIFAFANGTINAQFPDINFKSPPIPLGATGAKAQLEASITSSSISVTATTNYDGAKISPGKVEGTINGDTKVRIGAAVGYFGDVIQLTVGGETNINANGNITLVGSGRVNSSININGGISNTIVIGDYSVNARILGRPYTLVEGSYPFPNTANTANFNAKLYEF